MQTSNLPALSTGPSTKRTVPLVQGWAAVGRKVIVFDLVARVHAHCIHNGLGLVLCLLNHIAINKWIKTVKQQKQQQQQQQILTM